MANKPISSPNSTAQTLPIATHAQKYANFLILNLKQRAKQLVTALFLIALPMALSGCFGNNSDTIRYRATAYFVIDGKTYTGSSVRETKFTDVKNSLIGRGLGIKDHGEAIIVDFGSKRGAIYVLRNGPDGSAEFPSILTNCFQVDTAGDPEWIAKFQSFAAGSTCELDANVMEDKKFTPYIVAFKNETNSTSVIDVETSKFNQIYGVSAYLDKIVIERVSSSTPMTSKVIQRLPWLKDMKFTGRYLEKVPRGMLATEGTLAQSLTDDYFTGN